MQERSVNKKVAIIISPNWRNYAKKYLRECMKSIRAQDYPGEIKIYLTDNETSPESYKLLRELAPEAELTLNTGNDGFAKGCNDSIKLALRDGFEYIFLLNMDTVIDMSCVKNIMKIAENNPQAGIVQARIMLYKERGKINSLGNNTHFLGFGYSRGYNEKWEDLKGLDNKKIMYPSGAGFLITAKCIEKIGLFDEELWMYNEDQDLGWKSWLAGFENILAPEAVVYHKYEFAKSIKQYYYMDRNRIIEILKNYKIGTLILIAPAFILMEFGLVLFSLKSGWFKEKLNVWRYFLKLKTWKYIFRERSKVKKLRVKKDREILALVSGKIWYQEIGDWKLKIINPFLDLYFKILKIIVIW